MLEIRSDLATIVDQARWAYIHGYSKAGHGLDAERGVDLSRTEDERMKGPTFDLEVGDHKARTAYQAAVVAVARADVLLASLVAGAQPPLIRLTMFARPDQLARVASHAAWRAEHATVKNGRRVRTIRAGLDRAVRGLSKAMDDGPADGIAHAETPCKTCKVRPRAERVNGDGGEARPTQAGECDTCATWRKRNGRSRPTSLDSGPLMEARAAQQRRRARGEDFGAA